MPDVELALADARELARACLAVNGCDDANAEAVADTITRADRDQCTSHGLFRVPGYVASLRSGKVNGSAEPKIETLAPGVLRVHGQGGFAPLALQRARDPLAEAAATQGIAALALVDFYHFAALWAEVEPLAERGLCAFAFHASKAAVAPAGGTAPVFGTDPMAFGWPRRKGPPMVFDQASSALAKGEVMIAARDGHELPPGIGIDAQGRATTDPAAVLKGALLPFGGYKGAAIALMVELLSGALIGEWCGFEAGEKDNNDGGPGRAGELMLALDPSRFGAADDWMDRAERLFERLLAQPGVRLPGDRRHASRAATDAHGIEIPRSLYDEIVALTQK
ncbi:MAG: Ldh family oxidoreductase [Methyloligellaceae bacterium]